jgi:hypothetical protein
VLVDYLVASGNPLAIPMQLRRDGERHRRARGSDAHATRPAAGSSPGARLVLTTGNGHETATITARPSPAIGYVPLHLFYNSGRHVPENGRELTGLLETLAAAGRCCRRDRDHRHSMGGLVTRSAATTAGTHDTAGSTA